MAGAAVNKYECPICHEDYDTPKILPCYHLVCKGCIIFWLKSHHSAECPICQFPILSAPNDLDPLDLPHLASLVDMLPTNFLMMSLVKGQQTLSGPHVCKLCSSKAKATFYCFQCAVKLCSGCRKHHHKLPVSETHRLWSLKTLTPEDMACHFNSPCPNHKDKLAEVYCSSHQELICMLCVATNHRGCSEVKAIADVAKEKRQELEKFVRKLKTTEAMLVGKVKSKSNILKKQHEEVDQQFDNAFRRLEQRKKQLHDDIRQDEEENAVTENFIHQAMSFFADTADQLLTSASDCIVLQMAGPLSKDMETCRMAEQTDVTQDPLVHTRVRREIQSALSDLARDLEEKSATDKRKSTTDAGKSPTDTGKSPTDTSTPSKPTPVNRERRRPHSASRLISPTRHRLPRPSLHDAIIASVARLMLKTISERSAGRAGTPQHRRPAEAPYRDLCVGDRVRLSASGRSFHQKNMGVGTVTAVPSRRRLSQLGRSGKGFVDVCWDDGAEWYCCHGHRNIYDLQLVDEA